MRTTKDALSAKLPASGIKPKPALLNATYANELTAHKKMVARIIINQRGINLTIIATTRAKFINHAKKIPPELLTGVVHLRPIKNLSGMSHPILEPERRCEVLAGWCRQIIHLNFRRRPQEEPGAIQAHICTQRRGGTIYTNERGDRAIKLSGRSGVRVYSDRGKRIGPVFSSVEKAQDFLSRN